MSEIVAIINLDGGSVDGRTWITADARIDAREELIEKLGRPRHNLNDAELILLAYETWGENCLQHLIGDFAFVIWDSRSRRLFCARDHFGVKPFFFANDANTFIFSNTLNAVRRHPRVSDALNEIAIGDYLLFGLNQDLSTTSFRDIKRLPAGHSLTIFNGSITTRRYWAHNATHEIRFRDGHSYVERFNELLSRAIKDRLRTNRVAVSMSGGLDSTSVAAIARELLNDDPAVHACCVVYNNLIPDQERYYSNLAADHIGIPITHINADRYSLFDERAPGDMDQPEPFLLSPLTGQFNDLLRLCARIGPVALTGYDGDAFMKEPKQSRLKIRTAVKRVLGKHDREPVLPKWIEESFAKRNNLVGRCEEVASVQRRKDAKKERRPSALQALNSKVWAPLFEGYDPGATKLDLEVRHPLIDVRLVEYLLAIPAVPWCVNKHILRVAMKDRLPSTVLNRPKTSLAGDPALQLARGASVRWLDSFEVNPQLKSFVNLNHRRSIADELTPDALWANLRVFALNYWLTNSQPVDRRTTENQVNQNRAYHTSIA